MKYDDGSADWSVKAVLRGLSAGIPANGFVRRVLTLVGGTVGAQILAAAFSLVLTRLYRPEDFGVLGLYSAYLSVLLVFGSLRYELAIPVAQDEESANALFALSCLMLGSISVIIAVGSHLLWLFFSYALFPLSNDFYVALLTLGLLGGGTYQALSMLAVRRKEFSVLAQTRILQSSGMAVVQGGIGFIVQGPIGLVVGDCTSRLIGVGSVLKRLRVSLQLRFSWRYLWRTAIEYRDFPLVMSWAAIFNVLSNQAPLILMPRLFGLDKLGEYFLTSRVLTIPISMISATVAQVFLSEAARSGSADDLKRLAIGVTMAIAAVGLPIYAGISVLGPSLFSLVFGSDWGRSGFYAQLLAPMLFLRLMGSTLSSLLTIGRRFGEAVLFTALELICTIVALWIGWATKSIGWFVLSYSILSSPLQLASLWRFSRVANTRLGELFREAVYPVVLWNLPLVMLLILVGSTASSAVSVLAWVVLSAATYLMTFRNKTIRDLLTWK